MCGKHSYNCAMFKMKVVYQSENKIMANLGNREVCLKIGKPKVVRKNPELSPGIVISSDFH